MSFVSLFSETYLFNESQKQLRQYADRIAITLASRTSGIPMYYDFMWERMIREIGEKNFSLAIYDNNDDFVMSSNLDSLPLTAETLTNAMSGRFEKGGPFILNDEGSTYAVYARILRNSANTKYGTIVVLMQMDRYNIDNLLIVLFLLSVLVAAVIAVVSGFIFSRQLTLNLKKLQKRADMLAKRQFDNPIVINSNDEIGELAQSIDEMAHAIEDYDRSQKVFLQNASHELRTPLMSIRGYVEGLRDGVFTENSDEIYESILSQTSRLERLVEDVMYLSKIETTKDIMQIGPVSTVDIINESIERVEGIAASNGISVVKGDIVVMTINGDGEHLATVFTNIFSNCLRFAKKQIVVEAFPVENGVTFTVTDDGPGINDDDIEHIFERFYKGKKGKHGLGLAIAKAIVVSHRGTITAYNRKDGESGAVFEIFLPI